MMRTAAVIIVSCACFNFSRELFDYDALIGRDTTSTLQHAFNVAEDRLGIPRLLDPDGTSALLC